MKKWISAVFVSCALLAMTGAAHARDTKHVLPISAAMATDDAEEKLDGSIKFYFAKQAHPKVVSKFDTEVANRKTNAFRKQPATACNWAFLSSMVSLEKHAKDVGANAVINIVSYYDKKPFSSNKEFECHVGGIVAGVVLKGDFVKIAGK